MTDQMDANQFTERCPVCDTQMSTYLMNNNETLKICDNEQCPQPHNRGALDSANDLGRIGRRIHNAFEPRLRPSSSPPPSTHNNSFIPELPGLSTTSLYSEALNSLDNVTALDVSQQQQQQQQDQQQQQMQGKKRKRKSAPRVPKENVSTVANAFRPLRPPGLQTNYVVEVKLPDA